MAKRILLTGASTGIGNATLQRLVAAGHEVVNLDVKEAPEGAAEHHHCDLSDPVSIDEVVAGLEGSFDGLGNIATPDDQAQVVVWLLAGESGWVNGVDLPVDGGLSAGMTVGWANPKDSPASRSRRS